MANTYTKCYFQLVFSPKNRQALISKTWKDELEMVITKIISNRGHKLLAIGAQPDHIHILIGYNVNDLIPSLVEDIKTSSNQWINLKNFTRSRFCWQIGYGAFTYSKSQISDVIHYIRNQDIHHAKTSFKEEYLKILERNEVEYNDKYVFEFFDDVDPV